MTLSDAPAVRLRAALEQVLVENAVTGYENRGLHSWRCEYPSRIGPGGEDWVDEPCHCVDSLLDDLVAAALRTR